MFMLNLQLTATQIPNQSTNYLSCNQKYENKMFDHDYE